MPARQRVVHVSDETIERLAELVSGTARTVTQIAAETGLSPTAIRSGLSVLPRTHQLREGRTIFYYQLPADVAAAAKASKPASKRAAAKKSAGTKKAAAKKTPR